ncbi:uncharacterized protein LOC114122846 [Aphis gossypii]|uniref:uncharacterized protein LOC114122846 n=1 Tax=Aphis gossypii TaxID=80765 RepID=UPI0021597ADE|nr:uncharacterized protein LOC114122846 [Aphis gossypii]
MICSKHFSNEDFNESDLLREKLMPDTKVVVRLKPRVVPTIFSTQNDISLASTSSDSNRQERMSRKREKEIVKELLRTSTPKKKKGGNDEVFVDENVDVTDINSSLMSLSPRQSYDDTVNDKGIQCEIGNEIYRCLGTIYYDTSFNYLSDENSSSEDDTNDKDSESMIDTSMNECFIVFWESLLVLFKSCNICSGKIIKLKHFVQGAFLSINTICEEGHLYQWSSQKKNGTRPEGNILIGASLTLSGILFNQMTVFCETLKLAFFSRTSYDKIIRNYTEPVINAIWSEHKKSNFLELKSSDKIWLAGDGQFDSPGFCAKYCTYTLMDLNSSKIIDFKLVQKGMLKGDLERKACELLLEEIVEQGCKIDLFLTDRHKGIRCDIRTKFPEIQHEFDIWHLSKSLMKRMKILDKKYPDAYLWKTSINNHLWWSSKTCKGDGLLLTQKFTSVLKHINNIHEWEENGIIQKCEHETLSEEYKNNTLWIHPDSESYNALKKILLAKDFLKDLQHAKHFVHTGRLESYHNVRLKYMPKRIHLKYSGMHMRSILAILDHNSNVNKTMIGDKMVYSKSLGRYTMKNRYTSTTNNWRAEIMQNVKEKSKISLICQNQDQLISVPKNIISIPKPDINELRSKKYSRFFNDNN